jgi:DNA-binding GntR family transcriptional regulator
MLQDYTDFTFEPKNASEKIYLKLKQMLFDGIIVPGQKLQYQDMAETFNVSRTPVKEAFQMMSKEGYLTLRPNKGFYVSEIHPKEIADLYELRIQLELLALKKAIENQNSENLEILRNAIEKHAEDVTKTISRQRLVTDSNVHLAIATMSQNKALYEFLVLIFSKIYLKIKVENLSLNRGAAAKNEHWQIYEAIIKKDLSAAETSMYAHITRSKENDLAAQSYLEKMGES